MFVQDDQIRFADKGSESGAVRGRKSCIMHVPAARPMSGAGTACLGTSYEWGRRVVSSCCFRSCFPSAPDDMLSCEECSVKNVLRRAVLCAMERKVLPFCLRILCCDGLHLVCVGGTSEYQLTRVTVYAARRLETTEALMYAINRQSLVLAAVLEGIRRQQRPPGGVHRMLTTRRAGHRRNVPNLRASREWQAVHAILLHVTHGRHAILWPHRQRRYGLVLVILRRWKRCQSVMSTTICRTWFAHLKCRSSSLVW